MGGLGTLAVFFTAGNLPIAIASGAAVFAAGSLLFKKPKEPPEIPIAKPMDDAALLEKGHEGTKKMHELAAGIDDEKVRCNADEVARLCDTIISMVTDDSQKLKKSVKLFTYYIPTINKTLELFRRLEFSDTDREAYDRTNRFLDDCETGLLKHIGNLSSNDLMDLSVEMEVMTNVMNSDGLVDGMNQLSLSREKK
jgi:hypothetical protein